MNPSETLQCNTLDDLLERQLREKHAFSQLTAPEQARAQVAYRFRCAKDPWTFLRDCVFTLNQVSLTQTAIQPFPSYLEYVRFLTLLWMREKKLAIPKSRRMFCSWTFISLYTQDAIFNSGRHNGFVSKKEDDSADLVSRAEFIYRNIPEWRIPRELLPRLKGGKMSKQPPLMEFEETYSKIQGFPQGEAQMRQFTLSGLLFDEWAFWEEAQASYSAAIPTLEGGGRLTGISSRSPGFFKKIVFDQLDSPDLTFREEPPVTPASPLEGIQVWKNPANGFCVVDLHYTADPRKRAPEFRERIRREMPKRDYEMEYERSWQTFEGRPVFEDFNKSIHLGKPEVEPGSPLLIGWDFGLTPAAIIAQLVGRRLLIHREFVETAGSISKLAPVVWTYLMQRFLNWMNRPDPIICYVDPAGFQRAQTDERTCADIMRKVGFTKILPGPVTWEARKKAVEDYLVRTYAEGPGLHINQAECPILIEGFSGGYRYPEKAVDVQPAHPLPIKNKYSHPHDALQYVASGATALARTYGISIPVPTYGFQQSNAETTKRMKSLGIGG